jgi:flagellar motor switch protein FliG
MSTTATKSDAGSRRVASLLLSLEEGAAAALLKTLDPRVLPRVAAAMEELEAEGPDAAERSAVWRELAREIEGATEITPRARDEAELGRFLELGLGKERATSVLDQIRERRSLERPFAAIENAPPASIAKALARESTAVRALALSHLPPRVSAGVLAGLEPAECLRVVQRLASAGTPLRETVDMVVASVRAEIERIAAEPVKPAVSERWRSIAEILNNADKEVGRTVLQGLDDSDKTVADGIREMMFTWDDLAKLERRSMQKVLSTVDTSKLALALKGASPAVEENVLANLSQRVRDMIAEERELLGPRPKIEVDLARADIMKGVRTLVENGELSAGGGAEALVS